MLQKFKEHININFPFLKGKNLLIAISGGLDSVVLTHLFNQLNSATIALAHCNFRLREKESDLDKDFVINLSQKNYNQIFTVNFDTKKIAEKRKTSTQIIARELRYNWFKELVKKHDFDFVLTAHHADDNLETFLINLTRGSGLNGFTGIPAINGNIVRTLLPFSRAEILNYAKKNNIDWREDASNASTKYVRNKIRHNVLPVLKEINPGLLETFSQSIENLKEAQTIIADRIEDVSQKTISSENDKLQINIEQIKKLSNPKAYLFQLLKDYNFTEWNDVYHLLEAQSGKQLYSKTHHLLKDRTHLILSKLENNDVFKEVLIYENLSEIKHPIQLTFSQVSELNEENKQTIYVDKDLLNYPLSLRKKQNGDYLYPIGMTGKKKLSKYFKDEKFSLLDKENTWLLCNANNAIIWVIGYRQDRRFSATQSTKKHLKITTL
ncbi:tRNA lysidine(34) synthetase TilS [Polaribacter sp.]|uniref:tRNA lysidine(34) synthetase TilS n=1 Tax=Polaribacter sp. TaxID=1920175 RepID=UPI0025F93306|nr:tRNA lysidine(34) synthetase TilS [Polaribacter sp.]